MECEMHTRYRKQNSRLDWWLEGFRRRGMFMVWRILTMESSFTLHFRIFSSSSLEIAHELFFTPSLSRSE